MHAPRLPGGQRAGGGRQPGGPVPTNPLRLPGRQRFGTHGGVADRPGGVGALRRSHRAAIRCSTLPQLLDASRHAAQRHATSTYPLALRPVLPPDSSHRGRDDRRGQHTELRISHAWLAFRPTTVREGPWWSEAGRFRSPGSASHGDDGQAVSRRWERRASRCRSGVDRSDVDERGAQGGMAGGETVVQPQRRDRLRSRTLSLLAGMINTKQRLISGRGSTVCQGKP